MTKRPDFFDFKNGSKAPQPFAIEEYEARLIAGDVAVGRVTRNVVTGAW